MPLEITKQGVIMITIWIVWALEVNKLAYQLSDFFAKVGTPQAHNDSRNLPKNIHKNIFLLKNFDWSILYSI